MFNLTLKACKALFIDSTAIMSFVSIAPNISQPVSYIMCSNESLPTQLTWITAQGVSY